MILIPRSLCSFKRATFNCMLGLFLLFLAACSAAPQGVTPPELAGQAAETVQASDGLVVIRADQFQANIPRGKHSWQLQQDAVTPVGTTLVALPDINGGFGTSPQLKSPQLDYRVRFTKAGTHYVWLYGQAPAQATLNGDSIHVGLNGQAPASASRIGDFKTSYGWINLKMSGGPATLYIAKPGSYTLNVWMREDGARFSAIALSNNARFRPNQRTIPTTIPAPVPTPEPSPSNITPVQARPADAFVDSVGVNTHLHYTDTVWGQKYNEIIKPKLLASGIRHARDGLYTYGAASRDSFYYTRLRELGAAGMRFNLITGMKTRFGEVTNFSLLDDVYNWTNGAVVSYEGVNEPDIQGVNNWTTQAKTVQSEIYRNVKSNPSLRSVAVIGPSPVWEPAALGNMSDLMDYGNSHAYSGGAMPMLSGYGSLDYNLDKAAINSASDPVMVTEVGYHNALKTSDGHPPASEKAAAIYMPRLLLSYFKQGVARTYLYEFIDTKPDPSLSQYNYHFGLLRNDGSEKPAYFAVKNLLNLLKDSGGAFTPGSLRFELTGQTQNVQQVLLQKRDGTFYLALWVEEESWDRNARRDLAVASRTVNLQVGDAVGTITRYAFSDAGQASPSTLTLANGELSLALDDKLTLIALPTAP